MEQYIFDKNNVLWYELKGDYYIPCLVYLPKRKRPSAFGGSGT